MEESAHIPIHYMHACVLVIVLGGLARIKNDAESEKMAIWAEKQIEIDSSQCPEAVLIDNKINKLEALEDKQGFYFRPALNCPWIVVKASDHKLCHH